MSMISTRRGFVGDDNPLPIAALGKSATAVTPSNSNDLSQPASGLYIGGAGDLRVTLADDDSAVTFTAMAAGFVPLMVKRVWATGTTATGILALR